MFITIIITMIIVCFRSCRRQVARGLVRGRLQPDPIILSKFLGCKRQDSLS